MRQKALRPINKEVLIKLDPATRPGVDFHHPSPHSVGIELGVDRPIERIRKVYSPAVAADLDHLRRAVQRPRPAGMLRPRNDPADPQLAGQLWVERVGNIVLVEVASAPT